jgi:hypothetical protein
MVTIVTEKLKARPIKDKRSTHLMASIPLESWIEVALRRSGAEEISTSPWADKVWGLMHPDKNYSYIKKPNRVD